MNRHEVKAGDIIIIDPCYIVAMFCAVSPLDKWRKGDGEYDIFYNGVKLQDDVLPSIFADSGEVVAYEVLCGGHIDECSGFSRCYIIRADEVAKLAQVGGTGCVQASLEARYIADDTDDDDDDYCVCERCGRAYNAGEGFLNGDEGCLMCEKKV